jgi:hypothetical protein
LVYSQFGALYELIPNAPCTSTDPSTPSFVTHSDSIIGSIKTQSASHSTGATNHSISTLTMVQAYVPSNSSPTKIFEVNAIQSASPPQYGGENKSKNKSKKNNN